MQLKWDDEYPGPGQADPKKSRAERAAELRTLLSTREGAEVVDYYFAKYTEILKGKMGPIGAPMIETILNHEYPNG